ncbi:MAG: ABC transporter substrate-binding protein [Proteobacteria bacterium]|nr:ABC transporter substrate-binding protein [Pseudomonadota bacterium]
MIWICLVAAVPVRADQGRLYKIATVAWAGWSPLHVAEAMGFWKEAGISVQVRDYDDPIVILEAIRAGRIDFAMDMAGTLVGLYMADTPVQALAETNWSDGGDKIIVKRGGDIRQSLGQTVGVFLNMPSCLYFLGTYLKTRDLKIGDFRIVEVNPEDLTAQFVAGRIPVIVNYDPWATLALRQGDGVVLATSARFEGCIPECLWGYRDHLRQIPDEDVKKLLQGWVRAARWVNEPANWPDYARILRTRTFRANTPLTDDDLRRYLDGVGIHAPAFMLERNRNGGGLERYLVSLRAFLQENGLLKKDFQVRDIFDNRLITEVLAEELKATGLPVPGAPRPSGSAGTEPGRIETGGRAP